MEIPATDYLRAMRVRALVQQAFVKLFLDVDVLLTPTRFSVASKVSDPLDGGSAGRPIPKSRGLNGLIPAGNLAGLPAISLPCGFADNMPIAISLVGRPFSESHLIALGSAYQSKHCTASPPPAHIGNLRVQDTNSRSTLDPATPVIADTYAGVDPLRCDSPCTACPPR